MTSKTSIIIEKSLDPAIQSLRGNKRGQPNQLCSPAKKSNVSFLLHDREERDYSASNLNHCCIRFIASSESDLIIFRRQQPPAKVVVLSPVVPHPPCGACNSISEDITMDPFEPLGRSIGERYAKPVCHIPYVPTVGMSYVHEAILQEADAVLLIVCDLSYPSTAQKNEEANLSPVAQQAFAANVVNYLCAEFEEEVEPEEATKTPSESCRRGMPALLLVHIGTEQSAQEEKTFLSEAQSQGFRNVIFSNCYTPAALARLAELIFN